jgi:hypothetical protein
MSRFRIEIDHSHRINRLSVLADLDVSGLKEMMAALWKSAGFDPAYATLLDMTRVSLHSLDFAALREFFTWILEHDPRQGSIGVAVGQSPASAAIGKMIDALRDIMGVSRHRALRHFTEIDEAQRWLAAMVPPAKAER